MFMICSQGQVDLVCMLLDRGADIYGKNRNQKSRYFQPLHLACQSSAPTPEVLEVVKLLVERGADILEHDGNNDLPLTQAVDCNHAEVVEFFLRNGADPSSCGPKWYGTPPLVAACGCDDADIHPRIVHLLLEAGASPKTSSIHWVESVTKACSVLSVQKVLLLLAYKAQPRMAMSDFKRLMILLLNKARDSDTTPKGNYLIILELLLAAGLKLTVVEWSWLESGLPGVEDEKMLRVTSEVITKTMELFNRCLSSPQKLTALCRIAIRSSLLPDIDVKVRSLPVPTAIQNYLCFGNIAVRTTFEDNAALSSSGSSPNNS